MCEGHNTTTVYKDRWTISVKAVSMADYTYVEVEPPSFSMHYLIDDMCVDHQTLVDMATFL